MTYKTQEIIAKCLKQFDLRLFEEIGGNIQEKKTQLEEENKKKNTFRAFASRANNIGQPLDLQTVIRQTTDSCKIDIRLPS